MKQCKIKKKWGEEHQLLNKKQNTTDELQTVVAEHYKVILVKLVLSVRKYVTFFQSLKKQTALSPALPLSPAGKPINCAYL